MISAQAIDFLHLLGIPLGAVLCGCGILLAFIFVFACVPPMSAGEAQVARCLARLPPQLYKVANNVMLPTVDGMTTQIDHVVVSPFGIFVIETKTYSGWIFGDEQLRFWVQSLRGTRGVNRFRFQNPLRQNWRHIYAIEKILRLPHRNFINVVVFCGNAEIKSPLPNNVLYKWELLDYIRSFKQPILCDEMVEKAFRKLCAWNASITPKRRRQHVYNLHAIHSPAALLAACERGELKCPKCGERMVLRHRHSDNKPFFGCSRYPKCRGIRSLT